MKQTVSKSEFMDALLQDKNANWSYEGASNLFDYLDEYESDTGEEIEFDRVAIRCGYSEFESLSKIQEAYTIKSLDELRELTTVIGDKFPLIIENY